MVFPSVPVYLDPHNWQQQQSGGESENNQLLSPSMLPPPTAAVAAAVGGGNTGTGPIRPGSMTERARLARLPQPETALKCPRCESINTKFCYFNNYSLTQPRHFCKTCRRYWTRGGALRNVPVGGGCRRNKRIKGGNRSKSPNATGSTSTSAALPSNSCTNSTDHMNMIGHFLHPPQRLPFLPSLPHLRDYGSTDIGLNFTGIQPPLAAAGGGVNVGANMEFQIGTSSSGDGRWRLQQMQQFPFLAGLEPPPSGIYPFEGEGLDLSCYTGSATAHLLGSKPLDSGATQMTNVKVEENNQGLNLSRNVLGIQGNDHYNWGGNAWTDLSGFTSSTSHLL